jgi:chitinase
LEEIENIITTNSLTPVWDKTAAVKWITWDSNQWVSYDDDDTFQQKRTFANSRCLGGTMVRNDLKKMLEIAHRDTDLGH